MCMKANVFQISWGIVALLSFVVMAAAFVLIQTTFLIRSTNFLITAFTDSSLSVPLAFQAVLCLALYLKQVRRSSFSPKGI